MISQIIRTVVSNRTTPQKWTQIQTFVRHNLDVLCTYDCRRIQPKRIKLQIVINRNWIIAITLVKVFHLLYWTVQLFNIFDDTTTVRLSFYSQIYSRKASLLHLTTCCIIIVEIPYKTLPLSHLKIFSEISNNACINETTEQIFREDLSWIQMSNNFIFC